MSPGGDAAEQVVRLYLEGFEVAARLTGSAAKDVARLLVSVLKEQKKTRGRARLSSMLRSGRELKVFTLPQKDLQKFVREAKRYGVLYCVLREKGRKDGSVPVDIIARADDASKIQRIVERFQLGTVDKAALVVEAQDRIAERAGEKRDGQEMTRGERIAEQAVIREEKEVVVTNPTSAKTDKDPLSERDLKSSELTDKGVPGGRDQKPSVREKLQQYARQLKVQGEAERSGRKQERAPKRRNKSKKKKGRTK